MWQITKWSTTFRMIIQNQLRLWTGEWQSFAWMIVTSLHLAEMSITHRLVVSRATFYCLQNQVADSSVILESVDVPSTTDSQCELAMSRSDKMGEHYKWILRRKNKCRFPPCRSTMDLAVDDAWPINRKKLLQSVHVQYAFVLEGQYSEYKYRFKNSQIASRINGNVISNADSN